MEQPQQVQPLRQPRTFWQWLSGQEGTLFVPLAPIVHVNPARSALDAIETAISHIHSEMSDYTSTNGPAYLALVERLGQLHAELIRRSQEESDKPQ